MKTDIKKIFAFWGQMFILSLTACESAESPMEHNFTVPSWTLYTKALKAGQMLWMIAETRICLTLSAL